MKGTIHRLVCLWSLEGFLLADPNVIPILFPKRYRPNSFGGDVKHRIVPSRGPKFYTNVRLPRYGRETICSSVEGLSCFH